MSAEAHYLQRIAKATERMAELLETLMVDDELIEPETVQYAQVANKDRTRK